MNSTVDPHRTQARLIVATIVLLAFASLVTPYLVRLKFDANTANGSAAVAMFSWLGVGLTLTDPRRSHLSEHTLSRIYVLIAVTFPVSIANVVLYLWFFG